MSEREEEQSKRVNVYNCKSVLRTTTVAVQDTKSRTCTC